MRHPSLPVILLTAHGTIPDAVEATARGVFTYLTKPYDAQVCSTRSRRRWRWARRHAERGPCGRELARGTSSAAPAAWPSCWPRPGWSPRRTPACCCAATAAPARNCWRAPSTAPARAPSKPFMAVNCGAIPEALLESELFGHVKGAFTDAVANHKGLFQAGRRRHAAARRDRRHAAGAAGQAAARAAGARRAARSAPASRIPVDVRIISATHRDLDAAMAQGQFREDLYYRLNVVTLTLPPLGERREDIPLLANHFLQRLAVKYGRAALGLRAGGAQGADRGALAGQRAPALQRGRAGLRARDHAPGARWRWCSARCASRPSRS